MPFPLLFHCTYFIKYIIFIFVKWKNKKIRIQNTTENTVIPQEKCQRFQFEHPFTCMVAGMTGSGETV